MGTLPQVVSGLFARLSFDLSEVRGTYSTSNVVIGRWHYGCAAKCHVTP